CSSDLRGFVAKFAFCAADNDGSNMAARQIVIKALYTGGFTSTGRLRWCPPLKLYDKSRAKLCPRSRSMLRLACCEYANSNLFPVGKPKGRIASGRPAPR